MRIGSGDPKITKTQASFVGKDELKAASKATPQETSFEAAKSNPKSNLIAAAPHEVSMTSMLSPVPQMTFVEQSSEQGQKAVDASVSFLANLVPAGVDSAKTFTAKDIMDDGTGMVHVRLNRSHEGMRVFGEQVLTHLNKGDDGSLTVRDSDGDLEPIPAGLSQAAVLSKDETLANCRDDFQKQFGRAPTSEKVEEVIFKGDDGVYKRGYYIELAELTDTENPAAVNYLLDGSTGLVDQSWEAFSPAIPKHLLEAPIPEAPQGLAAEAAAKKKGKKSKELGDDQTVYYGKVNIPATEKDGQWVMTTDRYSVRDGKSQSRPNSATSPDVTDKDNTWGAKDDPAVQNGLVDLQFGFSLVLDVLKNVAGIDSVDGKGAKLVAVGHTGQKMVNAFSTGQVNSKGERETFYGDGDGKRAGPLTEIKVHAHEWHHQVQTLPGLIYNGESGGIMEFLSDTNGVVCEYIASQMYPGTFDFTYAIGDKCWTPGVPGDALRYPDDPKKDNYSVDNYKDYPKQTEMHGSCGIFNNMFYLATHGGTNKTSGKKVEGGMDIVDFGKIANRATLYYMTPKTTFKQGRVALIKAATDLFGADSKQVSILKEACDAVGVTA